MRTWFFTWGDPFLFVLMDTAFLCSRSFGFACYVHGHNTYARHMQNQYKIQTQEYVPNIVQQWKLSLYHCGT